MRYIDIHSHILPGMDDGARDIEESLLMAAMAERDGIEAMVATPHVIKGVFDNNKEDILDKVGALNEIIKEKGINLRVFAGAEYRLESDLPQRLADGELLTINDTGRYLLIELSDVMVPEYTSRILYELQMQGVTPIIAHPERNSIFAKLPQLLLAFTQRGILAQVTSTSITGLFGRRAAKAANKMLADGSVQILASDAHTSNKRAPLMSEAFRSVERQWGAQYAQLLGCENPEHIISGQVVKHVRPPRKPTLSNTIQRSLQHLMPTGNGAGRYRSETTKMRSH